MLRTVFAGGLGLLLAVAAFAGSEPLGGSSAAEPRAAAAGGVLQLAVGDIDTSALPNDLVDVPAAFDGDRHYVLQLTGPTTPDRIDALLDLGVVLGDYLPPNAYIVQLAAVDPAALAQLDFVALVSEYRDEWKLSPVIGELQPATPERIDLALAGRLAVDVTLFDGAAPDRTLNELTLIPAAQVVGVHQLGDDYQVTLTIPAQNLAELTSLTDAQFIEEAPEATLRNATTTWIVQSNVSNVRTIHNNGIMGQGQVVGIMDGKVRESHCSFDDTVPPGPTHRKILAYNTTLGSDFHGTHVAGIAVGDNGLFDNTRGVAYLGKLVYNTIPSYTDSAMYSRLQQHHTQGARLHTNSWGNDGTTAYDGLCRGIDRFSYDYEDSLVFFAVTNTSTLKNPENAKNLMAVGATSDTPSQHNWCTGGSGPTNDGRRKPEIYAPGCNTLSASSSTSCGTTSASGTSMASPLVAGCGMLVRQYFTDGYYPSGSANPADGFEPSGALVKAVLLNSAVDMTGVGGYPSNREGWGRVLLDYALQFSGDTRKLLVDFLRNADGLTTNETVDFTFNVDGSTEQLRITLAFTDLYASAGANPAAVNNLDLEVYDPIGILYRGNVFSGGVSTIGGLPDANNNVEQVHLNNPTTGTWTARVKATNVTAGGVGRQGYALAISGQVSPATVGCDGDVDGDGDTDFDDLVTMLASYGVNNGGDLDGDNDTDFDDLIILLGDYGCA